jgi:hypothetical protein
VKIFHYFREHCYRLYRKIASKRKKYAHRNYRLQHTEPPMSVPRKTTRVFYTFTSVYHRYTRFCCCDNRVSFTICLQRGSSTNFLAIYFVTKPLHRSIPRSRQVAPKPQPLINGALINTYGIQNGKNVQILYE